MRVRSYREHCSYPDRLPVDTYKHYVANLDQQSFPSHLYARIDDILMGAFFNTKRHWRSYRALTTSTAFLGEDQPAPDEEMLLMGRIFCNATKQPFLFEPKLVNDICCNVSLIAPGLFSKEKEPILMQLANPLPLIL